MGSWTVYIQIVLDQSGIILNFLLHVLRASGVHMHYKFETEPDEQSEILCT